MARVKHLEGCGMGAEEDMVTAAEERFEKAHAMGVLLGDNAPTSTPTATVRISRRGDDESEPIRAR